MLNKDGSLRRIMPPSYTAEERTAIDEAERKRAAAAAAKKDAVRRDRNLLIRYPNLAAHNKAREAALDDVRKAVRASEQRLAAIEAERRPLLNEAEFYKGKQLPTLLKQQLDANEAAATAQRDAQVNQKAELDRIGKRYDVELAHLKRLWGGAEPGSIVVMAGGDSAADNKAAKPVKPASTQSR